MVTDPPVVLLVEDEPTDVDLTEEALGQAGVRVTLQVASDGEAALEYLRRAGHEPGVPRPVLVLLDLNLPRKDGRMVLAEVRRDPSLRRIPIVVLTSSDSPRDVHDAYDLGANAYVTKSMDFHAFARSLRQLFDFWLDVAVLPRR